MAPLTDGTRERIAAIFAAEDRVEAERIVDTECGDSIPLVVSPEALERIRFAAIRVSAGELGRLRAATRQAQVDWRDLLVAAGFAHDPKAHLGWWPRRFGADVAQAWRAGARPGGVELERGAAVDILSGPRRGSTGTVVDLLGLEPDVVYSIALSAGGTIEARQHALRRLA